MAALLLLPASGSAAPTTHADPAGATSNANHEPNQGAILLVRTPGDEEVINRIRVDLRAFGWRIIEVPPQDESLLHEPLERLAAEYVALAALRVDAALGQIEIHIGRPWGNVYEVLRTEDGRIDGQILALRATEALRAHGLHFGPAGRDAQPNGSRNRVVDGQVAQRSRTPSSVIVRRDSEMVLVAPVGSHHSETGFGLQLGTAVGLSPGGLGVGFLGLVGARFDLSPVWSVSGIGWFPLVEPSVRSAEGHATIATHLVGVTVERVWLRRARWFWCVGVGVAGLWTTAEGRDVQAGYHSARDTARTAAFQLDTRVGLDLARNWGVFGALHGGASIPEVRVELPDDTVRAWGRPYLFVTVGAEVRPLSW